MRDLKNKLTTGKSTKNISNKKSKSFGYQILGFGSGSGKALVAADYLVVAGGATGGKRHGGGGGAGGHRTSYPGGTQIEFESGVAITVGAGGTHPGSRPTGGQNTGTDSVIDGLITSTRGGGGIGYGAYSPSDYFDGGSGGGAGHGGPQATGGSGNTPPFSPPQGNDGGNAPSLNGGGGGGASGAGSPNGGNGGGGGAQSGRPGGSNSSPATENTGSGSGGTGGSAPPESEGNPGNGGSGVVVIRVPAANDPGTLSIAPGTNSISDSGGDKICTFTVSGTLSF